MKALVLPLALLAGCGQRGPLFLPDEPAPPAPAPAASGAPAEEAEKAADDEDDEAGAEDQVFSDDFNDRDDGRH